MGNSSLTPPFLLLFPGESRFWGAGHVPPGGLLRETREIKFGHIKLFYAKFLMYCIPETGVTLLLTQTGPQPPLRVAPRRENSLRKRNIYHSYLVRSTPWTSLSQRGG